MITFRNIRYIDILEIMSTRIDFKIWFGTVDIIQLEWVLNLYSITTPTYQGILIAKSDKETL